jgi:hypothetical protein
MLPFVSPKHKPLAWLQSEVKSPPFSAAARVEARFLLRRLQRGDLLPMPHSRPMTTIGPRCHCDCGSLCEKGPADTKDSVGFVA